MQNFRLFSHSKNKYFLGLLTCVLCLSSFFGDAITADAKWYEETDIVHSDTNYEDMAYSGFDSTKLLNTLSEMESLCKEPGHNKEILADYQVIVDEMDLLLTQNSLNSLRYYNDVNNEEYQKIDSELTLLITDLADSVGHTLHIVLQSSYYDIIANAMQDEDLLEYYLDYEDMTPEERALHEEENKLVQKYDQEYSKAATYVDANGKIWTQDLLDDDTTLDSEQYEEISQGLLAERNAPLASIYLDLVAVRNRQAKLSGYDNYAEYSYWEIYGRDYTTEDIQKVYQYVKEDFVPILPTVYGNAIDLMDYKLMDMPDLTEEKIVKEVAKYIPKIDPELMEAYNYMLDHHLYDMAASDTKMDLGYTDYLYTYHAPVIYYSPGQYYYDYSTLIHEFGHYNEAYHNNRHALTDPVNMDVAEIHSQGLELLYLEYCDKLFKGSGDSARMLILYNIVSSVIEGCLYDEFQNKVYTSEKELTVDDLNAMFAELAKSYGYADEYADSLGYSWVEVSHTFQSPMYYISYATSALSALDIFSQSQHDRQKAIDSYMKLTTYGLDTPYCELIKKSGLRDIFEQGVVKSIATDTMTYSSKVAKHAQAAKSYRFLRNVGIVLVILIAIITLIVIWLDKKLKKLNVNETEVIEEKSDIQS